MISTILVSLEMIKVLFWWVMNKDKLWYVSAYTHLYTVYAYLNDDSLSHFESKQILYYLDSHFCVHSLPP